MITLITLLMAFLANVILLSTVFLFLRNKPLLLLRSIPIVYFVGFAITFLIIEIPSMPIDVIQAVLISFLPPLIPWLCGLFWALRIRINPIEIKSIVFDATSSLLYVTDPTLVKEYPVPYETAKKYMTQVPIELHNRIDKAIIIQSVWLEVWPIHPYPLYSLNPLKRRRFLMRPSRLADFGWKEPLPFEVPPKGSKTVALDVFYILALCDALVHLAKNKTPVPSARFVFKHSFGMINSKIFGLASFSHFYQKMAMSIARRDLATIVSKDVLEETTPKVLYKDVVTAYSKLGYDEIIASTFLLWHLQAYYSGKKDYINYVQQQHDRIVKPLIEAAKRKLAQFKLERQLGLET